MACLSLSNGNFSQVSFSSSLNTTAGGVPVVLGSGGLSVNGSLVLGANAGINITAAVVGGQFVVAMTVENLAVNFPNQRQVFTIDPTSGTVTNVLSVLAQSGSISLPVVQASPGTGSLLATWAPDGPAPLGQIVGAKIVRSDTGAVVVAVGGSFTATGNVTGGEVTPTQVIFHFHAMNAAQQVAVPRPAGAATVTSANPQSFGTVPVGGCPITPPTRTYTIKNTGADCLSLSGIANNGPYTVQSTTPALPATLDPNDTLDVVVRFSPAGPGTFNNTPLAVTPNPPNGALNLLASGTAVTAAPAATFSATTFNFGSVPNGVNAPAKTLTITNTGTAPLTVTVAAGAANGFSWTGVNTTLTCGASATVTLNFSAGLPEGAKSATFQVTHGGTGSPQTITLNASVCVANPLITAPPAGPLDFGQVQQGFKTVKLLASVDNPGDGPLTFTAEIVSPGGPNPALGLFGIPDPQGGQVTGPTSRQITVNPQSPCGGTAGTGAVTVPVSFSATQAPGVITGLALRISATNPAFSRDYPLSVEIVPPIPLDVALVVDRSGSMNDPLGSRTKIDAAVSASQLFVELLRPDLSDRVSLVRFSTTPDTFQPIVPVTTTVAPTQSDLRTLVSSGIPPASGWTGITGGTLFGLQQVQTANPAAPPITKAVIVLTDGIENRAHEDPPGSGHWFTLLGGPSTTPADTPVSTSPLAFPGGVKVFAVGLGRTGEVSDPQLNQLMQPAGAPFRVDQDLSGTKYFELEKRFTQIFMDVAGLATVTDPMYWIGPGDTHEIEFEVLNGDVQAMIVLYDWEGKRLPFHCVSPRGEILDPVSVPASFQLRSGFTPQTRVVEFKMPFKEPDRYAGTWKVVIRHPGIVCSGGLEQGKPGQDLPLGFVSRRGCKEVKKALLYGIAIGVGSNFRMQPYVTPGPVYVGEPILLTAVLSEAGLPVTGGTVTVAYETPAGATGTITLRDDGAHNDGDPDNGEYARLFTSTPVDGVYHFAFHAVGKSRDGKDVVREAVRDKEVLKKGTPPGTHGNPGDGRPGGGDDECCKRLLTLVREQTALLEQIAKRGGK